MRAEVSEKTEKKTTEKELAASIKKEKQSLNALLAEAKGYPDWQVHIRTGGVKMESGGLVNQITIDITRTEKL